MFKDISDFVGEDVFDSRDFEERIEELEGEFASHEEEVENCEDALNDADEDDDKAELEEDLAKAKKALADWNGENAEELRKLKDFREEVEGYCDWNHGETFIAESYFVEYCEDLVKDIGDLPRDLPSYLAIDWEKTAENLKVDYSEATLEGSTFFFRCC